MRATRREFEDLRRQLDHPPDPQGLERAKALSRKAYHTQQAQDRLGQLEFLYQQGRYLHKRWWVLQGVVLALLWFLLRDSYSDQFSQRLMSVYAPLFVLLLMPELWKNRRTGAMEIENTAFYSLRQIYAARLTLFALVDLLLLTVFFLTMALGGFLQVRFLCQFFLPFAVTCCICFRTLYSRVPEPCAMLLCVVWSVVWMELTAAEQIYALLTPPLWLGLLGLSLVYLAYCVVRGQKRLPKLWEGTPIWN